MKNIKKFLTVKKRGIFQLLGKNPYSGYKCIFTLKKNVTVRTAAIISVRYPLYDLNKNLSVALRIPFIIRIARFFV